MEVVCPDCGVHLGHQAGGEEIQWELWKHARCPVRLARVLGLTREHYDHALGIATVAIAAAYPDFPNNVLGDDETADLRTRRAHLAAEVVLESLGTLGFRMSKT